MVVVRKDHWKSRAKSNVGFITSAYGDTNDERQIRRKKLFTNYYKRLIPFVYNDGWGLLGWIKYVFFYIYGWFKPVYRQVRRSDLRVVAHKSAGLAAQTFMLAMSAKGYDTCPMEGSDTLRVKRLLQLPHSAEINMIIACGIREPEGIYGERFRIPFEHVYKQL